MFFTDTHGPNTNAIYCKLNIYSFKIKQSKYSNTKKINFSKTAHFLIPKNEAGLIRLQASNHARHSYLPFMCIKMAVIKVFL